MTNDTRTCTQCGELKPSTEFAADKRKASGRKSACKACDRNRAKRYYEKAGRTRRGHTRSDIARPPIEEGECHECGTRFTPLNRGGIYCSRKCSGKARRTVGPRPPRQLTILFCVVCKDMFESWHPHNKTCSPECQRLNIKHRSLNSTSRRRMRIKESGYEPFQYTDVYERDHWVCAICGEGINPELRYPDRMSVSLDHIVPLSQGGAHSMQNAQAAHWICNVKRGVTPTAVTVE